MNRTYYILIENEKNPYVKECRSLDELSEELSKPFYEDQKWHILVEVDNKIWEWSLYDKDKKPDHITLTLFIIILLAIVGFLFLIRFL